MKAWIQVAVAGSCNHSSSFNFEEKGNRLYLPDFFEKGTKSQKPQEESWKRRIKDIFGPYFLKSQYLMLKISWKVHQMFSC